MSDDFMAKYEEEQNERKKKAKAFLLSFAEPLKTRGYKYLVAYFDGSGDDGQIGEILLSAEDAALDARYEGDLTGDNDLAGIVDATASSDAVADFIWALTPDGFENNAGGFGAVILDAEAGTVKVNYSYRVEDSCEQDYEV
jgi:hypothetical protein